MVGVHSVGDQIWCQSLVLLDGVRCCLLVGIRYHSVALILLHMEGVRWIGFVTRVELPYEERIVAMVDYY